MGAVYGVIKDAIVEAAEFIATQIGKAVSFLMRTVFHVQGLVIKLYKQAEKTFAKAFSDGTEVGSKHFDRHNIEDVARMFDEVERRLG